VSARLAEHDLLKDRREPLDWYIEVCAVCGCQLGPGIGSRTRTGRCIYEEHRRRGGVVVRVVARPLAEQPDMSRRALAALSPREASTEEEER